MLFEEVKKLNSLLITLIDKDIALQKWVKTNEAIKHLGTGKASLNNLVSEGIIKRKKSGKYNLYWLPDILELRLPDKNTAGSGLAEKIQDLRKGVKTKTN